MAAGVRPICLVVCGGCSLTVQMWNLHVYGFGQAASQARFQRFHGSSFRLQLIIAGIWMKFRKLIGLVRV